MSKPNRARPNRSPLGITVAMRLDQGYSECLWYDYYCAKCQEVGSAPIPENESALNAASLVCQAHAKFNPKCAKSYQGRWVRIRHVSRDSGACGYGR